jgi:arylsulfatase A-like enzyme
MNRNTLLYTATGSLLLLTLTTGCKSNKPTSSTASGASLPNVVYVFPDQMRNCAMGFWREADFADKVNFKGDPVVTPNINRFARESVVLTSAQSNCPLSSPHRGMLLTGMYANKSGVPLNCNASRPFSSVRQDIDGIGDVFSHAGYECAYFGKLHADAPQPNDPDHPGEYVEERVPAWDAYTPPERRHGFNHWYSYGTFDEHKNPHYWDTEGHRHDPHEWSPIHEAKQVAAFIRNEAGKQRDADKPFFIMVGMNPPHSPYRSLDDCMEEDYALYRDLPVDSLLVRPNADRSMAKTASAPFYFASVTGVDRAFGMILDALAEKGLDKNTIVVFASDHGETMCSQGTNDPKNSPYVESMNVPFIVRYPDHIKPHTDPLLLSTPDIMPTLLGLSGLADSIPTNVQGRNLAPLLLDANASTPRPDAALYIQNIDGDKTPDGKTVLSYFPSARGIKTARYTLALYIDRRDRSLKRSLLFDDETDPYQLHNIPLDTNPELTRALLTRLASLLREIDDPWYTEGVLAEMIPY